MIDWRTAKIASSGIRGIRLRLRHVTIRPSVSAWRDAARADAAGVVVVMTASREPLGRRPRRRRCLSSAAWPVRRQEDVVERRPAQADVVDGDARLVEVAHDLDQRLRAARGGTVSSRVCSSSVGLADADRRIRTRRARGDVGSVVDDDLDALAADLRLELVGRAAGDDLAVVDDRDRVGQLVGLLEVLGREQQRRALADEAADDVPHAQPAARVEAGRRLVEEQQPRPADQRAGRGRAGGACRPSRS